MFDPSLSVLLNAFASDFCWAHFLPHRKIHEIDILSHSPVTTNQNGNQGRKIAQFVISMFKFFVHSCVTVFAGVTFPFTGRCLCTQAMCTHVRHAVIRIRSWVHALSAQGAVSGCFGWRWKHHCCHIVHATELERHACNPMTLFLHQVEGIQSIQQKICMVSPAKTHMEFKLLNGQSLFS